MDDTERRTAKRSRFDQKDPPESKRASRFDRRSRSPPASKGDNPTRTRSPVSRDSDEPPAKKNGVDPAAAAGEDAHDHYLLPLLTFCLAAAAAKINAQLQAKKAIQQAEVQEARATQSPPSGKSASPRPNAGNIASTVNGDMYIADGDYIRDIEVNDLRNRYTLTKGSTQKMVNTPCVIFH